MILYTKDLTLLQKNATLIVTKEKRIKTFSKRKHYETNKYI